MVDEETKSEAAIREQAEKRVKERIGIWWTIGVWLFINVFMIVIWLLSGRGYPWFLWVLLGTSVGLFFSLWGYFSGQRSESRKERMVEKEMEKIKQGK